MDLVFIILFFVAGLPSCLAVVGTISFNTTLVEVEEQDYNQVDLKVQRTGGTNGTIDFSCKILNSTNDFYTNVVTSSFSNGTTTAQCEFFVKDDTEPEGNETFTVQLSLIKSGNGRIVGAQLAYIRIMQNDDGNGVVGFDVPNEISFQEPRATGGATKKLPIRRSIAAFGPITVEWRVISPNMPNRDITPTSGVVNFQDGEVVRSLEFSVRADLVIEQDEDFEFALTSVGGGARLNNSLSKVVVRILANDIPVRFALSHITVLENQTNVAVWVYRGLDETGTNRIASVDRTSNVSWYLQSDGAQGNLDFLQASGTVVFDNGETRMSITVGIINDNRPEISENFTVHLTNLSADVTLVSPSVCTIEILPSDDHIGVFGISGDSNITISEDSGNGVASIMIERTAGAFGMVNVTWRVISSHANLSSEISPLHGVVKFGDGARQMMVNISVKEDKVPEEAFSFTVELVSLSAGRLSNDPRARSRKVVVKDSDDVYGVFLFANDSYQTLSLTSRPRMLNFAISRNGGSLGEVTVDYLVTYLSADGADQTTSIGVQNSGSVTFSPGQHNAKVGLNISSEGFLRADSVFRIRLTSVKLKQPVNTLVTSSTPRLGSRTTVNLTVHPRYADGEIGFELTRLAVTEPDGGSKEVNLQVFRDGTFSRASLLWSIVGLTSSRDLNPTSGSLVFEKGDDSVNITIQILPDTTPELDESFTIQLHNVSESNQKLLPGSSEMVLTILRNDNAGGTFQFDQIDPEIVLTETRESQFSVTVVRIGGDLDRRLVKVETINGKDEFVTGENVLVFGKGVRRKSTTFFVSDDDIPETNKTLTFRLLPFGRPGEQGTLGNPVEFNVTILASDDPNGIIVFGNTSLSIAESKGERKSAHFVLKRQRGLFGDVSVLWNVTSRNRSSLDVSPTTGRVEFGDGEQYKILEIFSLDDNIPELDEKFTITLLEVNGGVKIGDPHEAVLTILRNDDGIEFKPPTRVRVSEGQRVTFTILRHGRHDDAIRVNYTTRDGLAKSSDGDYNPVSQQIQFGSGETQKSITVFIPDDDQPETDENFTIVLTSSTGDTSIYGNTVAVVTIAASDDPNGIFHFDGNSDLNKTASERNSVSFRVVRDRGIFGRVNVHWQIYQVFSNNSRYALTSRDFQHTSGSLVFNDREPGKDLVLNVLSDDLAEYGENFEVVLYNVTGGSPGPGGKLASNLTIAYIHIPTNDNPYGLFAFAPNSLDVSVAEDTKPGHKYEATANLTIVRKRGKDRNVGVSWCIYKANGAANLGEIWDLIFLSKKDGVTIAYGARRTHTGSNPLEFTSVNSSYAVVESLSSVPKKEFTISAWLRPKADKKGTILAKVLSPRKVAYRLLIDTNANVTLTLEILVTGGKILSASKDVGRTILDDKWHNIMVAVDSQTGVSFYYDGKHIGTNSTVSFNEIDDGEGDLYLGVSTPNVDQFDGLLQDVKIFTKNLQESEVNVIANPVKDVTPINGYLDYPESLTSRVVSLATVDNKLTENEKVYSVILVSSRGGADVDEISNSRARLTVLKSDNANGLFEFNSGQSLSRTVSETVGNITFDVQRTLGSEGEVTIEWVVYTDNGTRATEDFVHASGSLVFGNVQKQNILTISVLNDQRPELQERFTLRLVSAQSNDGKKESTSTSGASVNPVSSVVNITIEQNDSPYGLLQFASEAPRNGSIVSLNDEFRMQIRESIGTLKLYIERAQGTLGNIECSWKTVPLTAVAGVDYVADGNTVSLAAGELSKSIDISITDDSSPELNKTFGVELYDAKHGAEIGPGGVAAIVIQPSDDAFGVVNFTSSSLSRSVNEGQAVDLELRRSGGALGDVLIGWEVVDAGGDWLRSTGEVLMRTGERTATLSVEARDDLLPELAEWFLVRLVNVTSGRLASRGTVSNVTVLANDDPYGVFEFEPKQLTVDEATENITIQIVRQRGTMGKTRVYYSSVSNNVSVDDVMYRRAAENLDYRPVSGFVDFQPNQTSETFVLTILDDVVPEANESILVNLTSVRLFSSQASQSAVGSPRIGGDRLVEIVILRNDNASGIVYLSSSAISVEEDTNEVFLNIVRGGGVFGEITVDIEVVPGSSDPAKDYRINASKVTLSDGQRTAAVPISIINDEEPEFNETFTVRLTSSDGSVVIGSPSQCEVIIKENDYPYGLVGFSPSSLNLRVSEPSSGSQELQLRVVREYGTLGVVRFAWEVRLSGRLATSDVQQPQGEGIIFPGENGTSFKIMILADTVPEVDEVLSVSLRVIQGGAHLNPARSQANVTIIQNDDAHGIVEFRKDSYTVEEKNRNITARIPVVRKRGTHGDLKLYYSTLQNVSSSFAIPYKDYIPVINASVTISDGSNTSSVDVVILGDVMPELRKYFIVVLERVELLKSGGSSRPRLGARSKVNVTLADDDNVYGLFKVFAEINRSRLVVNETEGLPVTLEVRRFGGATGDVSVMVVYSRESTARENEDFRGSDVTFNFKHGDRTKSLTLSINADDIPERDETIIMQLVNPTGGASVAQGTGNNVTIVIQANDVVAGYVGFSMLSQVVIVREGEMVDLKVARTSPAAGMVTVDWLIQGRNVTRDFNETSGTVVFKEGQNSTYIRTRVTADNTSEVDEEFQVTLRSPMTSGVSQTGAAKIDARKSTATVTVAASNEPHGVFEFQQSSRRISVKEDENIVELSVARLFGNIGTVRLHYTIINGSLHSLASDERIASIDTDLAVNTTSILIKNGLSVAAIPVSIVNDNFAELDEYFIVNITRVELVNASANSVNNETFIPPRLGRYLTSEVKIEKNDGPQGILIFSPARVNVPENISSFNLTVLRTQGTFGDIEVNYFISKVNISKDDFSVYGKLEVGGEATLKFPVGQRTQNITIFINDDAIPEGDEQFEVHLKAPRGGAQLGLDRIAYVTVLVNDAGNGIFRFGDGYSGLIVDEPGSRHVGTTQARFTVERENGTIGEVVIGWSIANVSAWLDFKAMNGTMVFKDGERRKSFVVETMVDTVPEKEERFLIVLSVVRGGGEVRSPSQAWLTVTENDEPYGELDFAVAPRTLNIEEATGYAEIKVLRRKGTYGTITVDYHTISQTADSSNGPVVKFGVFQSFQARNATTWYPFEAYGKQYLLLGVGDSGHGDNDAYVGSGLYYWQGVYTRITNISTNNPVKYESFHIDGQYYIAVANHGSESNYEVASKVYQMFDNGTVSHCQDISTKAASGTVVFKPQGSSDVYLVFANMKDNTGSTDVLSEVYKWTNGSFVEDRSGLHCPGASGLALFTLNSREFLAISSFYDSVNLDYKSKSVIFEWQNRRFKRVQEISTDGATGVEYFMLDGDHFLLFVNSRSSPALYKWNGGSFVLRQNLPITNAKSAKEFSMDGAAFLVSTTLDGSSLLLKWNSRISKFQFYTNVTEYGTESVQPITIQDTVNHNLTLLAVAMTATRESRLLQPAMVSAQADFLPRKGQLTFDDGDTELSFLVTILNDSVSEPDETFMVVLSNATGGSVIGPNGNLVVKILTNGNPYGRIEFAMDSGYIVVDERSRDWMLYLEVLRKQGNYGEVIVAWNSTGNVSETGRHGDDDVYPGSGQIVFLEGETRKTINLTIVADDVPEVNEVFQFSLTSLIKDGSDLPNQGAKISSAQSTSTVIIRANDDPHGIVGWQRTVVLAQESEAINSTVQLVIERQVGTIGDIKVFYSTVEAMSNDSVNERPAVPDQDYLPVSSKILMADGVNVTNVSIHVIHDNDAEVNEVFNINITAVQLVTSYSLPPDDSPRINPSSQIAKVVISENDNRRGELNFKISHLVDPRTGIIKVNEDIGVLRVPVVRSGGTYGEVGFEYRLVPHTVNDNDFSPMNGELKFNANETNRVLVINITDDDTAEIAERFRLEMTQPIGGAKLGTNREVTVEIRASDQPYGVFEFSDPRTVLVDEGHGVRFTVVRSQGSFREVHVSWNISDGAFPDIYPANGTLTFHDNVTSQVIRIRARDDDIPEGDKLYHCYLVSADNGGVIGSDRQVGLRIDVNDDGYGVMAIDATTSLVYVSEPDSPSQTGEVVVSVIRKAGAYGEIPVDWELTSDDQVSGQVAKTFNVTKGTIVFGDGVRIMNITLQVKQDPNPEETANYTLRIVATRDAKIDQSASWASVVVVSSDHPYGILDFVGPSSYNVSEDVGQVTLKVHRNKGHAGKLLVTINVVSSGATEGMDFEISPKVLTIEDKKDSGSINVSILAETMPELAESFFVSLGNIRLVTSRYVNYGYVNGLQVDMPPETGEKYKVAFTILKNDDVHGVVEFRESRLVVHEHDKKVVVSVLRTGGSFGVVEARYTVTNITARYGEDYLFSDGQVVFQDGQDISNLTIPLLDDSTPEDQESFRLDLASVNGGARLGERKSLEIVLETSDNPDGLFGFVNKTRIVLSNPSTQQILKLGVARIGGARSFVRVTVRAFLVFPNPDVVTDDITPIANTLTFEVGEFGPKISEFGVLPYLEQREVEEHFQFSITEVSGSASIDSITQNVTVVILKHGMPNGLFGFATSATQSVSEDTAGPVQLTVERKEGRKGTVKVEWAVRPATGDFADNEGSLIFLPNEQQKRISLTVVNDKTPELSEEFTVTLLSVNGGGDLDGNLTSATVTIRASDYPHGRFRLGTSTQRITVEDDLSRVLRFTVQRTEGKFGDVSVNYQLAYSRNYPGSLNRFVVIRDGESEKVVTIVLDENAFLFASSHFTLTLSGVVYQSAEVSEIPPSLLSSASSENIPVLDVAANSLVKFKDGYTAMRVNEDNQVPRVIVTRDGLYGNVTVSITSGYPDDEYAGFTKGIVRPSVSTLSFHGVDREKEFSMQITPVYVLQRKMVYAAYISRVVTPQNVRGGARIDENAQTSIVEPGGVLVVAMDSQDIVVRENDTARATVYRLFSTLGTIQVNYLTRQASTALPNRDYVNTSSKVAMADGEYRKEISVSIINDNLPELDETFSLELTSVTGANARLGTNKTSIITIKDDDSPHGVLSFTFKSIIVHENVTRVDVVVSRIGGTFGDVGVLVRSIGGGESWTSEASEDIRDVLGERDRSRIAEVGDDYYALRTRLTFNNEVPTPSNGQNQTVQLRIINDRDPETDEEIYLYLSQPTGGAILANTLTGGQSWAVVRIKGNDLLNGKIYFKSNSLTLDEDNNPTGEIEVTRTQSLGIAKVQWKAFNSNNNLEETSGTITFATNEDTAALRLILKQDNDPELQSNFTVKLVSLVDTFEAVIDPSRNVLTVNVLESDDPAGLIAFDPDSRNLAIDVSSKSLTLEVARAQGTHGRISVSYITTMLAEKYTDNDLVINRAIESKDYQKTQGVLVFESGQRKADKEIVIELTPNSASDTAYPKAFNVTLFNITASARLNEKYSKTMVIISNSAPTTQFLKLRSDSLKTPLSNDDMIKILQSLFTGLNQQSLAADHVSITADVLNTILDDLSQRADEKQRKLTNELSNVFMNVFDVLLDPARADFRGKSQLTEPFVKYAFALLHGESCPGTVVRKKGKFATVEGRRRNKKDINHLIIKSSSSKNFFTYPSNIYETTSTAGQSTKCGDVHFIEYYTAHWFNKNDDAILNDRVLSTSVKNSSGINPAQKVSYYRIYTGERRVTPKGAECLKWHNGAWDNSICSIKEESEDYVECKCKHFSNFAVRAQSDDRVGYEFYFYIAAFICMISFFLVILSHHMCSLENTFSAKLLMHMFFAGFALHLLVVVAAYVSPDLTDKPEQCTTLGILIHYFLLAQFCWIFVQCCNLWRILVLNDEHTDRKFIFYFMLGWGIPVLFVALYIIITHALYSWDITEIYADVHNNGDMCFIPNAYGALASVLGPVLLFLLAVGVVTTQAYQVTLQWKLYDDIFRGHHNIREVMHLWIIFFGITMTWIFGGLHLAFGKLWLAIFFAIFDVCTGLYVFMVYFVLRNQCRRKYRDDTYLLQASSPSLHNPSPTDYYAERPVMYDAQSVDSLPKSDLRMSPPEGNEWVDFEYDGATPKGSRRGFNDSPLAEINPLYEDYHGKKRDETNDDVMDEDEEELSVDLNNLVRALKTGENLPEPDGKDDAVEMKQEPMRTDTLELRRLSIADTHV